LVNPPSSNPRLCFFNAAAWYPKRNNVKPGTNTPMHTTRSAIMLTMTGLAREAGAAVRVGTNEWARSSAAESRGREVQVGNSGLVAVSSGAFVSFDTEGIVFSWVGGILRRGALAFI
jgi:hypothetical protein